MSSIVPAGSNLPVTPAEFTEPWRPTDFRFRVRFRSSRKFGWPEPPFGDVGGGERGGGSGVVLLRRTNVGGGVFLSELFDQVVLLTRETGGGGGGA